MKEIVITRAAFKDLEAIRVHIATDSIDAAERVVAQIESNMRKLGEMPGVGHERPDVRNSSYRFWRVYSYFIAYRIQTNRICISRVVHGAQNFRKLFKPRH